MNAGFPTLPMGLDDAPTRVERRRARDAVAMPTDADCIRISGELIGDARVRYQAGTGADSEGRRAWLVCRLSLPGGLFVDVAEDAGSTADKHVAADRRTRHLRQGQRVTVWAKGAMTVTRQGTTVLQLLLPQIFVDSSVPRIQPSGDAS